MDALEIGAAGHDHGMIELGRIAFDDALDALYAEGEDGSDASRFDAVRQIADIAIENYENGTQDFSQDVCCKSAAAWRGCSPSQAIFSSSRQPFTSSSSIASSMLLAAWTNKSNESGSRSTFAFAQNRRRQRML